MRIPIPNTGSNIGPVSEWVKRLKNFLPGTEIATWFRFTPENPTNWMSHRFGSDKRSRAGIFLSVCEFNLRSYHLRLTLGRALLCSLTLVCVSQHRWLNSIGQSKATLDSLAITRDTYTVILEREKSSGQAPCSIFEQYETWTEPQLNLRWTWVCCAVILWKSSLWRDKRLDRNSGTNIL